MKSLNKAIAVIILFFLSSFYQTTEEKIGDGVIKAKVSGELNLEYVTECQLWVGKLEQWKLIRVSSGYDLGEVKFYLNIIIIIKEGMIKSQNFEVLSVEKACKNKGDYGTCLFIIKDTKGREAKFEGVKGNITIDAIDDEIGYITFNILVKNQETGKILKIKDGVVIFQSKEDE